MNIFLHEISPLSSQISPTIFLIITYTVNLKKCQKANSPITPLFQSIHNPVDSNLSNHPRKTIFYLTILSQYFALKKNFFHVKTLEASPSIQPQLQNITHQFKKPPLKGAFVPLNKFFEQNIQRKYGTTNCLAVHLHFLPPTLGSLVLFMRLRFI